MAWVKGDAPRSHGAKRDRQDEAVLGVCDASIAFHSARRDRRACQHPPREEQTGLALVVNSFLKAV